ncbi:hypothetical protein A2U01_0054909, partial [Trifolium medium]|nr:hypothetical protein [Trifolium medium]
VECGQWWWRWCRQLVKVPAPFTEKKRKLMVVWTVVWKVGESSSSICREEREKEIDEDVRG